MEPTGAVNAFRLSMNLGVGLRRRRRLHGLEAAVTADYDEQTAIERELVLRVASLMHRLRRAIAIETGLLDTDVEHVTDRDSSGRCTNCDVSQCFSGRDGQGAAAFDRVCRYETAPWRQLRQTLFPATALATGSFASLASKRHLAAIASLGPRA